MCAEHITGPSAHTEGTMMTKYRALIVTEGENGYPVTYAVAEGKDKTVEVYGVAGEHDDFDYVCASEKKVSKRRCDAEGITWPSALRMLQE